MVFFLFFSLSFAYWHIICFIGCWSVYFDYVLWYFVAVWTNEINAYHKMPIQQNRIGATQSRYVNDGTFFFILWTNKIICAWWIRGVCTLLAVLLVWTLLVSFVRTASIYLSGVVFVSDTSASACKCMSA